MLRSDLNQWQEWRDKHPDVRPDLSKAGLRGAHLDNVDLHKADLTGADLTHAFFHEANLCEADLSGAVMAGTNFCRAHLRGAILRSADLRRANFDRADLSGADLSRAKLELAILVGSKVANTIFTGCRVYGLSAWDLDLETVADQSDLRITREDEPNITVGNLEVAQFVYLLLHNPKIRAVIDTIGEKGVLILGRFTEGRKEVLNRMREKLQELGFVPMLFDFEAPTQKDFTETIKTLAGMSRFIIADITNPRSSPLELQALVPEYMIPFVPIIQKGEDPFAMFKDLRRDWVLDVLEYSSTDDLLRVFKQAVVEVALEKGRELLATKFVEIRKRQTSDYE
jgi:uncharacterized protein YjbI with pentapeptide repeats